MDWVIQAAEKGTYLGLGVTDREWEFLVQLKKKSNLPLPISGNSQRGYSFLSLGLARFKDLETHLLPFVQFIQSRYQNLPIHDSLPMYICESTISCPALNQFLYSDAEKTCYKLLVGHGRDSDSGEEKEYWSKKD